jgi:tRNA pseudouridine55 synthase
MSDVSGLLLLDKPAGLTSYDCVHRVKRILAREKVGHCGTLDPLAMGVLILLVGRATRQQSTFLDLEKQYWFRGEFGRVTDTGDREGQCLRSPGFGHVTAQHLKDALDTFVGEQMQTPPRFSALKFQGKRYYQWARQGVEIPRRARPVRIKSFELLSFQAPFWEARVVCSRGTYIRTLVEDVAERLGTGASVDVLIRERIGHFSRDQALSWETVSQSSRAQLLDHFQCAAQS